MKAKLEPLKGKYYSTVIAIYDKNDHFVGTVEVGLTPFLPADYEPSDRSGMDAQDISDNHYECSMALEIANKIVAAING